MPRPYSADLRERVLAACERREASREEIARRFRVAASTLYAWLGAARGEGRRGPKPRGGGRPPLGGASEVLTALVAERNDATLAEYADRLAEYADRLAEYADRLAERAGVRRSPSALCRALRALGLVRKKRRAEPPSGSARTWPRRGGRGGTSWPGSIRAA